MAYDSITYFIVNPTSAATIDIHIGYCFDPATADSIGASQAVCGLFWAKMGKFDRDLTRIPAGRGGGWAKMV